MASLRETESEKVQSRSVSKSAGKATHILGRCFHIPDISLVPGSDIYEFIARQKAALDAYGKEDFHLFLVCMSLAPRHSTRR